MSPLNRAEIAARVARDIRNGWHVNLGIGIPELIADHVPAGREIVLHSENGILGMGPAAAAGEEDWNVINAGKKPVTYVPGASFFDHATSFAIVRGRHLDLCVLGAYQVAENGDIANWARRHDDPMPAIGGAMDLAAGAQRIWVIMTHTEKSGEPRLLQRCTYPLTGSAVVGRIFTDLAVIEVGPQGFVVTEMLAGLSREALSAKTGARLTFAEGCATLSAAGDGR